MTEKTEKKFLKLSNTHFISFNNIIEVSLQGQWIELYYGDNYTVRISISIYEPNEFHRIKRELEEYIGHELNIESADEEIEWKSIPLGEI